MRDSENYIYRYKYLPFSKGALKVITDGTIKFSSPDSFNDPFDCKPYIDPECINDFSARRPDIIRQAAEQQGMSPGKRIFNRGKLVANLRRAVDSGRLMSSIRSRIGIVCMSRCGNNILMWSHYADHHCGLVVEFRIPIKGTRKDVDNMVQLLVPQPVTYSKSRPVIRLGDDESDSNIQKQMLTKSVDWKYEEEERAINKGPPSICEYDRDSILCSVVAGASMEQENYVKLETMVQDLNISAGTNVQLYKAEEHPNKYSVIVPGHPRLCSKQ